MSTPDSHRVEAVERAVSEIRDAVGQIADALVKIARLEERHQETRESLGRAFDRIEAVEKGHADIRVEVVKLDGALKPLQESRGWVVSAGLGVLNAVGLAIVGLVLVK